LTPDPEGTAKITNLPGGRNANGVYSVYASGTADQVVLEGVGTETLPNGNSVTVRMLVREALADSLYQVY